MAETTQPTQGTAIVEREELHFRRIDMRGWKRSDGLFEVEARLTDRKPRDFVPASGGKFVAAGDPIHDMGVRLVFNIELYVLEVSTFTDAAPYAVCPDAGPTLQTVVGLRMVSGWGQEVRKRLGGARSCTHLMELLMPMATVAYQSMSGEQAGRPEPVDATGRPRKIDSCFAYAAERDVVLHRWPQFHRPPANPA
jgi:hypothetical protein